MFTLNVSLILVLVFSTQIISTDGDKSFNCQICEGNRTNAYSKNLNSILSVITSNTTEIDNGFYNFSLGQEPNKAYVIAICRRDLSLANCRSNIYGSASNFQEICLSSNESVGYYNSEMMFRYSYKPILDIRDSKLNCTYIGPWPAPEPYIEKLRQKSTNLLSGLIKKAAAGNSRDKSAAGSVNVSASLSVYAITMCSPDLSPSYCFTCLEGALKTLQICCSMRQGPSIYIPGCLIETENYPFLNLATWNSIPPSPLIPFTPPIPHRRRSKPGRGIYIVIGVVSVLLVTASLFLYFSRRTKQNKQEIEKNNDQVICMDFKQFDFSAVQAATHNFSNTKRLGIESSARVYKGMLPGGQEIAVKMLLKIDKDIKRKFDNEVLLLTNLQHRNLVKLLGFCVQQDLMLLIYEFLPNESLDKFLLHDTAKRANLNWETRYNVIQGIARGLSYLHDDSLLRVIHRDLKPSNILLDVDMKPKISNFIKATHVHEDQTRGASSTIKVGICLQSMGNKGNSLLNLMSLASVSCYWKSYAGK
ncbi:cysteine-rich receptor-like protein kinase 11 isoform X2 [Spinacia oleracea]|uniref:Cysteine-rich receptor-like protein kinase 11 isoform X2 n=1 Tax=Spinacia oleracea TaxID=3562 RepID=A0ABM3R6D5_SPIOL|nr:cysteine-rich receptor-like protein kinase 11 isoform X2 [Spinacia oleracea]